MPRTMPGALAFPSFTLLADAGKVRPNSALLRGHPLPPRGYAVARQAFPFCRAAKQGHLDRTPFESTQAHLPAKAESPG